MKRNILIHLILGTVSLFAFEVNTHQAITRCALTQECSSQGGVANLENFVKHVELNSTLSVYENEIFEKYDITYKKYVEANKTGFEDWNISIIPNYHGMIEAGSVLEDALYPHPAPLSGGGDGRFNNHFYTVQFNSRDVCVWMGLDLGPFANPIDMLSSHAVCAGYGVRTDAIDWVFDKDVDLGKGRVNDYGLEDAFDYFKKSFEGNETERTKYQAKFFATLGFMSHMLQDLHSPAHVRDGSHALGDHLEIYGRYDKGFNLRHGNMNPNNEPDITSAIRNFDVQSYLTGMNFKSLEDFYYKEATWVSNNFFSEAHNWPETANTQTGSGLKINRVMDKDTIFDGYNEHLASDETYEEELVTSNLGDNLWRYVKTDGNAAPSIYGEIDSLHNTVAFVEKGFFSTFDVGSEHLF